MSVLFVDDGRVLPVAVILASVLGSGHCIAMCGGLVAASAQTRFGWGKYQMGRLAGYLAWGALAGGLGEAFVGAAGADGWVFFASWGIALATASLFLESAFRLWRGEGMHRAWIPSWLLSPERLGGLFRRMRGSETVLGALSSLLPCGWLQSFVWAAIATRRPAAGAGLLFVFWLGTLPALALSSSVARGLLLRPLGRRAPRAAAALLVVAAMMSIGAKMTPLLSRDAGGKGAVGEPLLCHSRR